MSRRMLSIVVYGPGNDPQHRSHWAFGIHQEDQNIGDILHVALLDLNRLVYQFDLRKNVTIRSRSSEGSFPVALLTQEQARQASRIISEEPAPRDGVERCQDWILRTLISLEAEEVIPAGTSERLGSLIGQPASGVAQAAGRRWRATEE